jgi:putative antitoxin of VapBC-like toxin-antitoxin system
MVQRRIHVDAKTEQTVIRRGNSGRKPADNTKFAKLIAEAQRLGKHRNKKEALTAALTEYVNRRKQLRILDAFGTIDFDPAYNYKAERRRVRLHKPSSAGAKQR